jgi:uncharacterized protein (TIGR02145 family)
MRKLFIIGVPLFFAIAISFYGCKKDKNSPASAPVADFSASQTSISVGQSISFTDLSTNTPTSWQWNFTGATPASSTQKNPTGITYSTAGTYNVTLTATNANGGNAKTKTAYITVTQASTGCGTTTVTDIDGNVYNTVTIGTQCWMQQNLKTTHYNNGAAITEIEDSATWANIYNTGATTPAWCYYSGNAANNTTYGKLYNWYVVTDPRGVCPTGYHVPTDTDLAVLSNYLGGDAVSGGHLKSTSGLWLAPNTGADNSSGFTALPAGCRNYFGNFGTLGSNGSFWSSTPSDGNYAWSRYLGYYYSGCYSNSFNKDYGFSVRCVGD